MTPRTTDVSRAGDVFEDAPLVGVPWVGALDVDGAGIDLEHFADDVGEGTSLWWGPA